MTAALTLQARLARDVKESPVKAIALAAGILLALYVWLPKLIGAAQRPEPVAIDPSAPMDVSLSAADGFDSAGGAVGAADLPSRDSLAIRSEFITISKEARELRRFADALMPRPSPRDPFQRPKIDVPVEDAEQPVLPPPGPDPALAEAETERESAKKVKLTGVITFGSRSQAVLNGRLARVGEVVFGTGGLRVRSIEPRSVTLRGVHADYRLAMSDAVAEPELEPGQGNQEEQEDRP